MQIRPWHAFPFVAALSFAGREFRLTGTDDILWFTVGTLFWGSVAAGIFWFVGRQPKEKQPERQVHGATTTEEPNFKEDRSPSTNSVVEAPTELLWEQALVEFQGNERKKGLWAKSLAVTQGNEPKAQAAYLQARVEQLQIDSQATAAERSYQNQLENAERVANSASEAVHIEALKSTFSSGTRPTKADIETLANASTRDMSILELSDKIFGQSILHWSSRLELVGATKVLLQNGANPNAPNGQGRRPFQDSTAEFLIAINCVQKEPKSGLPQTGA